MRGAVDGRDFAGTVVVGFVKRNKAGQKSGT
jgi:hypothetical protein